MTKAEALHSFMSGFGLKAYANQAEDNAAFPYLVYEQTLGSFDDGALPIIINLWYYGDSIKEIIGKTQEISETIGYGGLFIPYDGGAIMIRRDTPFSQGQTDAADSKIKGRFIKITAEYLSQN